MTDGTIYGTGINYSGELGIGNYDNKNTLTQILQLDGKTPETIACGYEYTMVIMTDGTLYGTGLNVYGQLGLGNNDKNNGNKKYIRCRGTHIKPFPSNIIGRRINLDNSSTFFIADE